MNRLIPVCILATALLAPLGAAAQPVTGTTTTGTEKSAIAKPPPGTAPPQAKRLPTDNASTPGNNTPTLPQIALHPSATIGSPVPIAGPGGTSRSPTGN